MRSDWNVSGLFKLSKASFTTGFHHSHTHTRSPTPPNYMRTQPLSRYLTFIHGAYYLIGGAWPLISLETFEYVTGPKYDDWLVRSVALLLVVAGIILVTQPKGSIERSAVKLAFGTSLALGCVAMITSAGVWISSVYFLDGTLHLLFAATWAFLVWRKLIPFSDNKRS